MRRSVFRAAKIGALFNDFPLVPPLKNFRKCAILVSLLNLQNSALQAPLDPRFASKCSPMIALKKCTN